MDARWFVREKVHCEYCQHNEYMIRFLIITVRISRDREERELIFQSTVLSTVVAL